jgi:hypothetical protein
MLAWTLHLGRMLTERIQSNEHGVTTMLPKLLTAITFSVGACLLSMTTVRRQTIWDQSARFLRDTFLPVTSPV